MIETSEKNNRLYGRKLQTPKLKIEYDTSLKDSLNTLGIKEAFENPANFSRMADSSLYVSEIVHKTFIKLNEQGN